MGHLYDFTICEMGIVIPAPCIVLGYQETNLFSKYLSSVGHMSTGEIIVIINHIFIINFMF